MQGNAIRDASGFNLKTLPTRGAVCAAFTRLGGNKIVADSGPQLDRQTYRYSLCVTVVNGSLRDAAALALKQEALMASSPTGRSFYAPVGISMLFPGTVALDNVDYNVWRGKVNVIIGENGAGKSTLMKILAGVQQPSLGEMELNGNAVRFSSTRRSRRPRYWYGSPGAEPV